ncbi:peptide chain release factor N(5)-glutamine methyltransferase [Amaricoccus solimangrovi]|uniref:Release factor glutamine methyltransferase n=1 Tax=Amaricoccus solimangrovi TaxID=2589815 RepID=A0A501WZ46_9RHOB|nr:peptide chain release factor N(5)-glutamine methyltransferase [Amaricoccus solimangrovi]TPE52957.1 peptide chain release factor N(5)-glutamine methyltransferase [Amaricoccus solimangrovi]
MSGARALLAGAVARLAAAGVADPARDARLLLAEALGVASDRLTLVLGDPVPAAAADRFDALLAERALRRPVSQILGRRAFWGREFRVTRDVLDPRPETETLIARALEGRPGRHLLDLGAGSGILLVTLLAEWRDATGIGTDLSEAALRVARENAARHGVAERAAFHRTDWAAGISGPFDVIVSNPPYIPEADVSALAPEVREWEPRAALSAGPSGLEAYERIAADLPRLLAPEGRALLEFGAGQGAAIAALFRARGFRDLGFARDLDGRERVLTIG